MKLLSWIRPREASSAELREQLRHADNAHRDAQTAVHSAQVAFDDAGDDGTAKTLTRAREAAQLASEHVARAKRLLANAEQRELEARHAELRRLRDELTAKLDGRAIAAATAPLAAREAALLVQVAEVRAERLRLRAQCNSDTQELSNVLRQLGDTTTRVSAAVEIAISPAPVNDAIDAKIQSLTDGDPLRSLLLRAKPKHDAFQIDYAVAYHLQRAAE